MGFKIKRKGSLPVAGKGDLCKEYERFVMKIVQTKVSGSREIGVGSQKSGVGS